MVSIQAFVAARLSALSDRHCSPMGVTTHAPPPAKLLVASMTAATMASKSSQTPKMRNSVSMAGTWRIDAVTLT